MIRGTYALPSCGAPLFIEENFLPYVLTVTSIDIDVGSPYFGFTYGYGKYSIRNNHIVCTDGCRCAFPVDGEQPKEKTEASLLVSR